MSSGSAKNTYPPVSFGAHVLDRDPLASWQEQEQRNREMLSHALNLRDTVVFVGAGCSTPLGYPSWTTLSAKKAVPAALAAVRAKRDIPAALKKQCERRLMGLEKQLTHALDHESNNRRVAGSRGERSAPKLSSSDLTFILGACERVCKRCGCATGVENEISFRSEIAKLFQGARTSSSLNPYDFLLRLPVHRFVTSNYDCELERALVKSRCLPKKDYYFGSPNFGKKSFAQTAKYDEQLAIFSIAFADFEPKIFHCHGWHHEPDSMVLTEDDYQEWYLRDEAIGGRYRQTIDLIFNSNPILFVGFSLTDDDLLVPLRFLSAVERRDKKSRPLFALLEKSSLNNERRFDQLYDRYGVHVLSYESPQTPLARRTRAMCEEIEKIGYLCKVHRQEWLEKPTPRAVKLPRKSFMHYDSPLFESLQIESAQEKRDRLRWSGSRSPRLIWIVGPGGTGKSWTAIRLLKTLQKQNNKFDFKGFFFWSFRYSNDALSGVERALRFMGATPGPAEGLLDQLVRELREKHYFVVLDGIERFLHENVEEGSVVAVDSLHRRFFSSLAEKNLKSMLVLTSRMLPSIFEPLAKRERIRANERITIKQSEGFSLEQIGSILRERRVPTQNGKVDQSLLAWFRGHRYGVSLAASWLQETKDFSELQFQMAEADPERQVSKMISLSLKATQEAKSVTGKSPVQLLERLALFVEPVTEEVARLCLRPTPKDEFKSALKLLIEKQLLFKVIYYDGGTRYMVHPSIREYVFHHFHHSSLADLPSFSLSGFTSATETVYPGDRGSPGKATVADVFESLMRKQSRWKSLDDGNNRVELCRAAFGIVRSRMVATTVSRWARYDEYLGFLVQVIDSARQLSQKQEISPDAANGRRTSARSASTAALYADELAWLYNEAGLAYYGEGSMMDAIAVWRQSYEMNMLLDRNGNGHYVFQSLCNLGAAQIHFGNLQNAESYLRKALDMGRKLDEGDHILRIEGYLALLSHLRGNIGEANTKYEIVTKKLRDLGNMRAYCIFLRHHADLLLRKDDTRGVAWDQIQTSKAVAEANAYEDLAAYARLSLGHLHRLEKEFPDAIREYRVALDLARTMGIRRLEAEAQSELARVDLDLGDAHVARRRAMKALQIANEQVLGLRQTHGLVILGKATIHAGERELGIHYLRYAKRLADKQEYRLRASEAEAQLFDLGEHVENSGVEASTAA